MIRAFDLHWNSADGQASLHGGEFASLQDAWASIPMVKGEFLDQCLTDADRDAIEAGTWTVTPKENQA